jgi:hypothetical protein
MIYLVEAEVTCSSRLFEFQELFRAKWHQAATWLLMICKSSCVENTSCRIDNPEPDIVCSNFSHLGLVFIVWRTLEGVRV